MLGPQRKAHSHRGGAGRRCALRGLALRYSRSARAFWEGETGMRGLEVGAGGSRWVLRTWTGHLAPGVRKTRLQGRVIAEVRLAKDALSAHVDGKGVSGPCCAGKGSFWRPQVARSPCRGGPSMRTTNGLMGAIFAKCTTVELLVASASPPRGFQPTGSPLSDCIAHVYAAASRPKTFPPPPELQRYFGYDHPGLTSGHHAGTATWPCRPCLHHLPNSTLVTSHQSR